MGELNDDLRQCLSDARAGADETERAVCSCEQGRTREAKRVLLRQRQRLLDEVHDMQHGIDAIDHMLHRMSDEGAGRRGIAR